MEDLVETKIEDINARVTAEASLLKVMSTRENYENYWAYVNMDTLSQETKVMGYDYKKYFDIYPEHKAIDWNLFTNQFTNNWHNTDLTAQDVVYYTDFVIKEVVKCDHLDLQSCLLGVMGREVLEKIAKSAKRGFNVEKAREILEEYEQKYSTIVSHADRDCFHLDDIDYSILDLQNGIPYFLPTLQKALGGLMAGNFVVVAADVSTGKSAFVISQAVHAFKYLHEVDSDVQQAGINKGPILYFNSEDTLAEVGMRFFSNLYHTKATEGYEQIVKNRDKTTENFKNVYNPDMFKAFQLSGQGIGYVRNKIKKYKPSLVILDITDKLAPSEDVQVLKKLFDTLRDLAAEFEVPIIGTTQAGDQSWTDKDTGKRANKKFLKSSDLYASKTGKGGSATVILSIGKDDEETSNTRYINISKKKRGSFARITCEIEERYSLYKEVF